MTDAQKRSEAAKKAWRTRRANAATATATVTRTPKRTGDTLREKFDHYNEMIFDGKLSATIEWSNLLKSSAGNCRPRRKLIRISTHYAENHPEDVDNVIIHEMVHLLPGHLNHGPRFKSTIAKINREHGTQVTRFSKGRATAGKFVYHCKGCEAEVHRERRTLNIKRVVCGKCRSKFAEPVRT